MIEVRSRSSVARRSSTRCAPKGCTSSGARRP